MKALRMKLLALQQKFMAQGALLQASKVMRLLATGHVTLYLIGEEFDAQWELEQIGVKHFNWHQNTYSTTFTLS